MRIFGILFAAVLLALFITPVSAQECKDVQSASALCVRDAYCAPKAEGGTVLRPVYEGAQPGCNEETHILRLVDSVDKACEIAKGLRQPLNCALGCTPGNMSENFTTDVKCCNVVSERACSATAASGGQ